MEIDEEELRKGMEEERTFTVHRCSQCEEILGSGWGTRNEAVFEYAAHALICRKPKQKESRRE